MPASEAALLVLLGDVTERHRLPAEGSLLVGSSRRCDVVIEHPSVAPEHIRLHVDGAVRVEDLGTSLGTTVRGVRLEPKGVTTVGNSDLIAIGDVVLLLRGEKVAQSTRQFWGQEHFRLRLAEECARARRRGANFSLLLVECAGTSDRIEQALEKGVRENDVLGRCGQGQWGALLLDADRKLATIPLERTRDAMIAAGLEARVGIASFPDEAADPDALIDQAQVEARGEQVPWAPLGVVVADVAMRELYRLVNRIAPSNISVCVLGETGAGKEVVAGAIHRLSRRATAPYLTLNCAALPETLLESELFGHERGAFTGAVQSKPGLLETADGGTVFLDEIGEMPASLQAKLLRVLEERKILRVGALKPRDVDVRIVVATHRDLEAEVAKGTFRRDLYFRLNGVTLIVPPLRERRGEVILLAKTFAADAARRSGLEREPTISREAHAALLGHSWPGNVRELRNVMERATLLCGGGAIMPQHLLLDRGRAQATRPEDARSVLDATPVVRATDAHAPAAAPSPPPVVGARRMIDPEAERRRLVDALEACAWNQTRAAERLGMSRRTLVNRLEELNLPRPRKRV